MASYCRFCGNEIHDVFLDLGTSPLANSYVRVEDVNRGEVFYPLKARVCGKCFLVQLEEYESPDGIFSDYAYLSSFSDAWLEHSKRYVEQMVERFDIGKDSLVVELASNDGYLLQYFKEKNVPVLGIEPAKNVAEIAIKKGIDTVVDFFGGELAEKLANGGTRADLIVANNVLAHVPDLNGFVGGIDVLLADDGIATVEFPYLLNLIDFNQFDTVYHEHFSYFSFFTANQVFKKHNMRVFRVEKLSTHGGSLRIYVCHGNSPRPEEKSVGELLESEYARGVNELSFYRGFHAKAELAKRNALSFLIEAKNNNKRVCAYGAPAKGNTLLNYCGIDADFIEFTVDKNPIKQNALLPGSRIPVRGVDAVGEFKPDYLIILPWNIKDEIMRQNSFIREWGGKFVTFIPHLEIL